MEQFQSVGNIHGTKGHPTFVYHLGSRETHGFHIAGKCHPKHQVLKELNIELLLGNKNYSGFHMFSKNV